MDFCDIPSSKERISKQPREATLFLIKFEKSDVVLQIFFSILLKIE